MRRSGNTQPKTLPRARRFQEERDEYDHKEHEQILC